MIDKLPDKLIVSVSEMRHNAFLGKVITEKGTYASNTESMEYTMYVFRQCLRAELEKFRVADVDLSNKTYNEVLRIFHNVRIGIKPYTLFVPENLLQLVTDVYQGGSLEWRDFILGLTSRWMLALGTQHTNELFDHCARAVSSTITDSYIPDGLKKDIVTNAEQIKSSLVGAPLLCTYLLIWMLDEKDYYVFQFNENIIDKTNAAANNSNN